MKKIFPILTAVFTIGFMACAPKGNTDKNSSAAIEVSKKDTGTNPVETKRANTSYKPAFAGQTRIGGVRTKATINARMLTDALDRPWGIAVLPDGRLLITEKRGSMVIATPEGKLSGKLTGIPKVNSGGQGGLLHVVLDPDFKSNRMIYWSFSESIADGNLTAVAKGRLGNDEKSIENATVIYRAIPAYNGNLHYGSRLVFDDKGNLFVSTGERSDLDTRPQAQQLNSALGKVLRIDRDGKPVAGNPFINTKGALPEIYTYGHRNVQGLAIHPVTRDLWENEFGPKGGDELNKIQPGKNYGWPTITYGLEYSGSTIGGSVTQKEGMEQPVYYWDPVLSPSGMTFYSSDSIAEWKNNLFITGLNSKHIARLVIENDKVVGEERLLSDENQRFRDIVQGMDGALYVVSDEGRLYRVGRGM